MVATFDFTLVSTSSVSPVCSNSDTLDSSERPVYVVITVKEDLYTTFPVQSMSGSSSSATSFEFIE